MDQVFTPDCVVREVLRELRVHTRRRRLVYLEPCVGGGSFWRRLPRDKRIGVEIDRRWVQWVGPDPNLVCANFLQLRALPKRARGTLVAVGAVPFRGRLEYRFMRQCVELGCRYLALLLPAKMLTWEAQAAVDRRLHLVHSRCLGVHAFDGGLAVPHNRRCALQIWTVRRRLRKNPKVWSPLSWNTGPGHAPLRLVRLDSPHANMLVHRRCGNIVARDTFVAKHLRRARRGGRCGVRDGEYFHLRVLPGLVRPLWAALLRGRVDRAIQQEATQTGERVTLHTFLEACVRCWERRCTTGHVERLLAM